jgi:hypothetical protein
MAEAPRPGIGRRTRAAEEAQKVLTITLRGEAFQLAIGSLPIREKLAVRAQTGMPIEAFVGKEDRIGEDSIVVLWWLARRAAGEPTLSFETASGDWPSDLGIEDVSFSVDSPNGDDPEALGPRS